MTVAYFVVFALSLLMIPAYFLFLRKKQNELWLLILFVCVATVNLGYTLIALSKTVEFALFANKVAYLGQVFVPMCMFILISKLCGYSYSRLLIGLLIGLAVIMFGIVCTTGYLDWYYVDATIESVAGATVLNKEYGVLHPTNLVYVVGYFLAMIAVLCVSLKQKKVASQKHAFIVIAIVLGNIAMWLVQKIIPWEFELLSVTYLMSDGAFFAVRYMLQDYVHRREIPKYTHAEQERLAVQITTMSMEAKIAKVLSFVKEEDPLAIREREILEMILLGTKRKDIALDLHLSENTVKTYTRTLYSKLGVTCREDLYSLLLQE